MRRASSLPFAFALAPLFALSLLATGCIGCQVGDAEDEAAVEERLDETGTLDVVEWAAEADYEAPADGKLSEEQVEMYVAVQQRAARIRQVARQRMEEHTGGEEENKEIGLAAAMRAFSDLGDVVTAELRAAHELGENPAEYQWVVARITEARLAAVGDEARSSFARAGGEMLAALEQQLAESDDEAQREALRERIAELRDGLAEQEEAALSEAQRHNLALYAEHRERIETAAREYQASLDG